MANEAVTYQKLVRKNSEDVSKRWRVIIVIILLLIIVSSFIVTFSFHTLLLSFNSNCILHADVVFTKIKNDTNNLSYNINIDQRQLHDFEKINRKLLEKDLDGEQGGSMIPLYKFMKFKSNVNAKKDNVSQYSIYQNNLDTFKTEFIDEANTKWGSTMSCEYLSFLPFLEGIAATIWLVLFIICGRGGVAHNSLIEEPWRLVVPAVTFFTIMSFIGFIHLAITHTRLSDFCSTLNAQFSDMSIPCGLLMNRFSWVHDTCTTPATNYYLTIYFTWITAFLWATAIVIMSLRCVCAPDFKLVNVQIPPPDKYQIIEDKSFKNDDE